MKTSAPLAVITALALAGPAFAVAPRPGPGDPRIAVVDYDPAEVVELTGVLGFQLSVEFDPGERIENVAIGDSLGWQVTPNHKANLLFLKPMALRPATNMSVVTNLRRYQFELKVRPKSALRPAPFAVRFLYPPPAAAVEIAAPPTPPTPKNTSYSFQGSSKVLPTALFDDGQATYFQFADGQDLPAIYALGADGKEAVINTHARDGYLVIDSVEPGFVLRRGDETARIVNDGVKSPPEAPLAPKRTSKESRWRQ
jgi:type IV secretion system protein VirB9